MNGIFITTICTELQTGLYHNSYGFRDVFQLRLDRIEWNEWISYLVYKCLNAGLKKKVNQTKKIWLSYDQPNRANFSLFVIIIHIFYNFIIF